jgi:hypothetical protein
MSEDEVKPADLRAVREDVAEIKSSLERVAHALERLARLEERQASAASGLERSFTAISKIADRVTALEKNEPLQSLTSSWVIKAVWGIGGAALVLILKTKGM